MPRHVSDRELERLLAALADYLGVPCRATLDVGLVYAIVLELLQRRRGEEVDPNVVPSFTDGELEFLHAICETIDDILEEAIPLPDLDEERHPETPQQSPARGSARNDSASAADGERRPLPRPAGGPPLSRHRRREQ